MGMTEPKDGEGEGEPEACRTVWPLGKYLILAELGRGGMAQVYLALARGPGAFNKLFVLKLLRTHLAEDNEFLEMFLSEARLAARLNHPNVVQTNEVGVEGGRHCIAMEYLEGRSYAEVDKATQRAMPLALHVRILADTLAGLHHAHELSDIDGRRLELVHRDVSPHNVFVTYDGQVKVLDFGIAKAADTGARTKTGVFKGKIRYTAPERFTGEESDRRSDLFSVGVMLWQALTKKRLWSGQGDLAIMRQLATGPVIPAPRELDPDVSPELERICLKALAPRPADRFQTAAEFQDALEEVLGGESFAATNRALGKYMGEVFGETRAQFQKAVDEQMRLAASAPLDDPSASMARLRAEGVPVLGLSSPTSESLSLGGIPLSPESSSSGMMRSGAHLWSSAPPLAHATSRPSQASPHVVRASFAPVFFTFVALCAVGLLALVVVTRVVRSPPNEVVRAAASPAVAVSLPAPAPSPQVDGLPPVVDAATNSAPKRVSPPPPAQPRSVPSRARQPPAIVEPSRPLTTPPKTETPKREVDCTSPYFVDDEGVKKIRPECL